MSLAVSWCLVLAQPLTAKRQHWKPTRLERYPIPPWKNQQLSRPNHDISSLFLLQCGHYIQLWGLRTAGKPYLMGRLSTIDLLVLTIVDQLIFLLKKLFIFLQNKLLYWEGLLYWVFSFSVPCIPQPLVAFCAIIFETAIIYDCKTFITLAVSSRVLCWRVM